MKERPIRVQRKRIKGWRMPPNTVSVTAPGRWSNPFRGVMYLEGREVAVEYYKAWIDGENFYHQEPPTKEEIRRELRGKNLACWCPLDQPCHADVLLEIANQPAEGRGGEG